MEFVSKTGKNGNEIISEKKAERLALDLADKLENNKISFTEMADAIDNFLINQKDGED